MRLLTRWPSVQLAPSILCSMQGGLTSRGRDGEPMEESPGWLVTGDTVPTCQGDRDSRLSAFATTEAVLNYNQQLAYIGLPFTSHPLQLITGSSCKIHRVCHAQVCRSSMSGWEQKCIHLYIIYIIYK